LPWVYRSARFICIICFPVFFRRFISPNNELRDNHFELHPYHFFRLMEFGAILKHLNLGWPFSNCFRYFSSKFHILDFLVIVASFIVDILLRGTIKEVASLIILIRLWRVFKIIEELSMGAKEQMEDLQEKIRMLEHENNDLRQQIRDVEQGRAM